MTRDEIIALYRATKAKADLADRPLVEIAGLLLEVLLDIRDACETMAEPEPDDAWVEELVSNNGATQ